MSAEIEDRERLERCVKAAQEQPQSAAAHFNLGLAYMHKGRVDRAEIEYRRALALDPDLIEAWVNLGGVLLLKWDFRGSLEANQEAIRRQADLLVAHYNMGQAYLYLGDAEGLLSCNRRVIELDPEHAAGRYFLAVGLLATDHVRAARQSLDMAMTLGYQPPAEFLRTLNRAEEKHSQTVAASALSMEIDGNVKEE